MPDLARDRRVKPGDDDSMLSISGFVVPGPEPGISWDEPSSVGAG
jgi:hypothetical protein